MGLFKIRFAANAAAADEVHLDIFNASSQKIRLRRFLAFPDLSVAVTGLVAISLFLTRTSAVGTGGIALAAEATGLTAGGIVKLDSAGEDLPSGISARTAPTGGATAGAVIAQRQLIPEETLGYAQPTDFLEKNGLWIPAASGVRLVQSSVASVGSVISEADIETE